MPKIAGIDSSSWLRNILHIFRDHSLEMFCKTWSYSESCELLGAEKYKSSPSWAPWDSQAPLLHNPRHPLLSWLPAPTHHTQTHRLVPKTQRPPYRSPVTPFDTSLGFTKLPACTHTKPLKFLSTQYSLLSPISVRYPADRLRHRHAGLQFIQRLHHPLTTYQSQLLRWEAQSVLGPQKERLDYAVFIQPTVLVLWYQILASISVWSKDYLKKL